MSERSTQRSCLSRLLVDNAKMRAEPLVPGHGFIKTACRNGNS
jgi:hypothetical protein